MPPIFFTICANLVYCDSSSCTSFCDTPAPRATRWIRPGWRVNNFAPSWLSSSAWRQIVWLVYSLPRKAAQHQTGSQDRLATIFSIYCRCYIPNSVRSSLSSFSKVIEIQCQSWIIHARYMQIHLYSNTRNDDHVLQCMEWALLGTNTPQLAKVLCTPLVWESNLWIDLRRFKSICNTKPKASVRNRF